MKIIIYVLMLIAFFGCRDEERKTTKTNRDQNYSVEEKEDLEKQENEIIPIDLDQHVENYQNLKRKIKERQANLKKKDNIELVAKRELAENYMSKILVDSIFQYWLGTKWDFNGISEKPKKGEIACGYFVSTTIRDLGIRLNRYKIAQKGASDIIHSLCDKETIERTSSLDKLIEILESKADYEVLIVGLDFHVGFIFKKENKNYFAHSNYINSKGVEIELIENSDALKNSNAYVIGNFTKNREMINKWLN